MKDWLKKNHEVIIVSTNKINIEADNLILIDFSKELLDTTKENEQKVIEAIVYTLTSIDDIKFVIIYVEGNILTRLPKSNIVLPATLDRNFGINKEYDLTNDKNIKDYNTLSRYNIHEGNILTLITFLEESKTIEIII